MKVESIYKHYPVEVEYRASEISESLRNVDYYEFYITKGRLFSPVTNSFVEDSITTRTQLEEVELRAFKQIQLWSVYAESGSMVWVSPPARNDLSAKVVISEIEKDLFQQKLLINRNICFDWDESLFMHFAEYAGRFDIRNGEDLRGKPIFLTRENKHKLFELLKELEPLQIKQVETGDDIRIKEELKAKLANGQNVNEGSYPKTCGRSAFEVFSQTFPCPRCGLGIPRGRGITTCPHCGARKEDYGSKCD